MILPSSVGISDAILSQLVEQMIDAQTSLKLNVEKNNRLIHWYWRKKQRIQEVRSSIIEAVKNQQSLDKLRLDFLNKGINDVQKMMNTLPGAEREFIVSNENMRYWKVYISFFYRNVPKREFRKRRAQVIYLL